MLTISLLIAIIATLSVITYYSTDRSSLPVTSTTTTCLPSISTPNGNVPSGQIEFSTDRGDVRFIVLADLHVGGDKGTHRPAVMEAVNQHPDFVILSGDMVFSLGYNQTEWNTLWCETLMPLRNANIPIYPVIGNHDSPFPGSNEILVEDMPLWSKIPWGIDIGKGWYSFIIGNIEFVIVENNYEHTWGTSGEVFNCDLDPYGYVEEQRNFTESALSESPRWLFLVSHKGAYWNTTTYPDSSSDTMFSIHDDDYRCNQKIFDEWLDKYQIDMFISGHNHFGDNFFKNGTMYSHVPAAYDVHFKSEYVEAWQQGKFGMYDVYESNEQYPKYPEGYIKIRQINFDGQILNEDVFGKNPEFIHE